MNKGLQRLEEQITLATKRGDDPEVARLRADSDKIKKFWNKDTRPGGRPRRLKGQAKKDLDVIRDAVKRVLDDLAQAHKPLHEHLQRFLHIGPVCVYERSEPPIAWQM